jgi:hypothetical protein
MQCGLRSLLQSRALCSNLIRGVSTTNINTEKRVTLHHIYLRLWWAEYIVQVEELNYPNNFIVELWQSIASLNTKKRFPFHSVSVRTSYLKYIITSQFQNYLSVSWLWEVCVSSILNQQVIWKLYFMFTDASWWS